jgi:hypothetical protein
MNIEEEIDEALNKITVHINSLDDNLNDNLNGNIPSLCHILNLIHAKRSHNIRPSPFTPEVVEAAIHDLKNVDDFTLFILFYNLMNAWDRKVKNE